MEVLVYLASRAGEVVSTEELIQAVWQGRVVGDGTVYQSITNLRQAFRDCTEDARVIETIPKRGYRLVADVVFPSEPRAHENTGDERRIVPMRYRAISQPLGNVLVGLIVLALGSVVVAHYVFEREQDSPQGIRRFAINVGPTQGLWETGLSAHVAISPDARHLAYVTRIGDASHLNLRPLNQLEPTSIAEIDGAFYPFFSPDGEWLAFFDDITEGNLKKISVHGGSPEIVANAWATGGGSWRSEDTIILSTRHVPAMPWRSLVAVSPVGGKPSLLLESSSAIVYQWPDVLPGGDFVLFTSRISGVPATEASVALLALDTGNLRTIVTGAYHGQYASSGHIVFARGGAIWAVPFDIDRMQMTGPETLVLEGVQVDRGYGAVAYSFSDDGTLVYAPAVDRNGTEPSRPRLAWVRRGGPEQLLQDGHDGFYSDRPRISPDGQRVALEVIAAGNIDIWIYDILQETSTRLTFDPSVDEVPLWFPDGRRLVFLNHELGGLFVKNADGTGRIEQLTNDGIRRRPTTFSPDGMHLIVMQAKPGASDSDLHILSLEHGATSRPLIETQFDEGFAAISPNGQWIAYQSNETGRYEIYVRPFPNVQDGIWQISRNGGSRPRWGSYGAELFYRSDGALVAVKVESESRFSVSSPEILLLDGYDDQLYDVSADGQSFLMMRRRQGPTEILAETELVVVENWFEELRRLAPVWH